ncbi:MAG: WYL domain-containing transcriptional regulator [Ruminococcaceae bacterium]|nr:WYL domain-containing transcriptional regulator [Oscillospiraceae bacterium]
MAQDNYRKIKLLKLLELLRLDTDEQHPMTTNQICARLDALGIVCDRRTLSKDIALLNEQGYEVMSAPVGHEKGYYVEDRSFSIPELKVLIDAVQAASFVTPAKTAELVEKIAVLGGSHRAEILKRNTVNFKTTKHTNEQIFYNVDALEKAIAEQKKILFRYFDLNEHAQKVYRREGHRYVVEPIALVLNEDNYYLLSYSSRHQKTSTYRVDRMDAVTVLNEPITEAALTLKGQVGTYTEQVFKMYAGEPVDIVLEFRDHLIGVVFDKFGEETQMLRNGPHKCLATVKVQVSPVFFGWLFQFAGEMRLLSPEPVTEAYRAHIARLDQPL